MILLFGGESGNLLSFAVVGVVYGGLLTAVLLRLGQLLFLMGWLALTLLNNFSAPLEWGRWCAPNLALPFMLLLGLAVFSFFSSLGGRPVLSGVLDES